MNEKINVFIVDDHNIVRKGLKMFLELDEKIFICGEAGNLSHAFQLISKTQPDVVLLDYKLPDGDGVIGCLKIKRLHPKTKIIILTAFADERMIVEARRAGAEAYLFKDIESDELISTIYSVYQGEDILGSSEHVESAKYKQTFNLTRREGIILEMISLGKTNKEIAWELTITEKTVRNYISIIFKKINVTNRTEAASFWVRQNNN